MARIYTGWSYSDKKKAQLDGPHLHWVELFWQKVSHRDLSAHLMMIVSNELTEWNTLEFSLTPMMWWLYNEGGVYDDVDSYDSGDDH